MTCPATGPAAAALEPGLLEQRDGRVAVTALAPLGRLDRTRSRALAELAPRGRGFGLERTLTVLDVEPRGAGARRGELRALGLVLDAGSGWAGLSACAGLGACAKARADVRAAAAARAGRRGPRRAGRALGRLRAALRRPAGRPGPMPPEARP